MINPLQDAWEKDEVPMEWKTGYIVKISKKRDLRDCQIGEESNFYTYLC